MAIARRANDFVCGSDRLSDGTNLKKVCSNGSSASSVTVELLPKLHFAENVASDIQPQYGARYGRPTAYLSPSSIKKALSFASR